MQFMILVERGDPGENYGAYCPDLPGCVATGDTVEETQSNMIDAIKFHLESMVSDGDEIPPQRHISALMVSVDVQKK